MNIFKRNWLLIFLLLPFFFISLNCGGGSDFVFSEPNTQEFQTWWNSYPSDPEMFVSEWNKREWQNWKYDGWTVLNFEDHENDTPFEIWQLQNGVRYINCYRADTLVIAKCPGGQRLPFMQATRVWHEVVEYRDPQGLFWVSFAGVKGTVLREWPKDWPDYETVKNSKVEYREELIL